MSFSIKPESAPDADFHADRAVKYTILTMFLKEGSTQLPATRLSEERLEAIQDAVLEQIHNAIAPSFIRAVRGTQTQTYGVPTKLQVETSRVQAMELAIARRAGEEVRALMTKEFDVVSQVSVDGAYITDSCSFNGIREQFEHLFEASMDDLLASKMAEDHGTNYILRTFEAMEMNGYFIPVDGQESGAVRQLTVKGIQYMQQIEEGSLERQAPDKINAPTEGALKNDSGVR